MSASKDDNMKCRKIVSPAKVLYSRVLISHYVNVLGAPWRLHKVLREYQLLLNALCSRLEFQNIYCLRNSPLTKMIQQEVLRLSFRS